MLALAAPVLALNLGFPDDGTKPESRTERRAYDLIAEGFGPGANGPLVIAVDISQDGVRRDAAGRGQWQPTRASRRSANRPSTSPAGVATLVAQPTTSPQDESTQETVARLRSEVFPAVLDGTSATAHVGGQTATFADLGDRVQERMLRFVAAVLLLSFLLLTVLFRSVLVPLKAVVLNLLSVGAAYGVLVMVFQWGWAAGLIGVESTVPIVSFIPLFMFAILFGLSMDYEVFLLSRVREEYRRHGDNTRAVIAGIAGTGRTITAAALIMVAVFSGFVLGSDPVVKMMGVGLATAIFLDATVVRLVLVPATMKLLGDANWWLPGWLDRLLPELDPALVEKPVEVAVRPTAVGRPRSRWRLGREGVAVFACTCLAEVLQGQTCLGTIRGDEAVLEGVEARAHPVGGADLGVGALDVVADRLLAEHEAGGDVAVGEATGDEAEDLGLAGGEGVVAAYLRARVPGHGQDRLHAVRVEGSSGHPVLEPGRGRLGGVGLAVGPGLQRRLVGDRGGEQPLGPAERRTGETQRVPGPVEVLVVRAGDRGHVREAGDAGQHPVGEVGVHPHPLPLGAGQLGRLRPDLVGHAEPADVVEVAGAAYGGDVVGREAELYGGRLRRARPRCASARA